MSSTHPAVVHYALRLCAVPLTVPNVIRAFQFLNIALLTLTALLWCRVAAELQVGEAGKWLGAIGLFANFAVAKFITYYPVLTDPSALALGMLLLHCYLRRQRFALVLLTALGAFVWINLAYQGALLLAFPRPRPGQEPAVAPPRRMAGRICS